MPNAAALLPVEENGADHHKIGYPSQARLRSAITCGRRPGSRGSPLAARGEQGKGRDRPVDEGGHDPKRWNGFRRRYRTELSHRVEGLRELRALTRKGPLTLVYAARDEAHNEAIVLRDVLIHWSGDEEAAASLARHRFMPKYFSTKNIMSRARGSSG
jgi:Inactive DUF488-N3 subclade